MSRLREQLNSFGASDGNPLATFEMFRALVEEAERIEAKLEETREWAMETGGDE